MNFFTRLFGPSVSMISNLELQEKLKSGKRPFVLDVREAVEYREAHIAGAKLMPLGKLQQGLSDLPKQRQIVCVCDSGSRSGAAARRLAKEGYDVLNMKGGMSAWQKAKLPVKKGMSA